MKEGDSERQKQEANDLFTQRTDAKMNDNKALIMSKMMQNKPKPFMEDKNKLFNKDLIEIRNFS